MTFKRKSQGYRFSPTDKHQARSRQLGVVYRQLAASRPQVCAGCGKPAGGLIKLSHSHLVPRSYNADLTTEPDNIAYHCLDWMGHQGCHSKWESNAHRAELLDFERNLAYIALADPSYYGKLILKTIVPDAVAAL